MSKEVNKKERKQARRKWGS